MYNSSSSLNTMQVFVHFFLKYLQLFFGQVVSTLTVGAQSFSVTRDGGL